MRPGKGLFFAVAWGEFVVHPFAVAKTSHFSTAKEEQFQRHKKAGPVDRNTDDVRVQLF